jgi:Notch-like protein
MDLWKIKNKLQVTSYNIVEAFNGYFKKMADNICNKIKANSKPVSSTDDGEDYMACMDKAFGSPFPKIQISKTTSVEIERIIKSLKSSYAYGYDEISNNILKACKTFSSTPLSYLCNRVLFEGVFPGRLKYATIIPMFKKGGRKDLSNYRPISILTTFNKIFEKVMYNRLVQHLDDHNILSKYQYGFRAKLGTDNAIFNLITEILRSLNHKSMIGGIF